MTNPIDPVREQGIRLFVQVSSTCGPETSVGMLVDVLAEVDRLRHVEQGLRTELSVYERRDRTRG